MSHNSHWRLWQLGPPQEAHCRQLQSNMDCGRQLSGSRQAGRPSKRAADVPRGCTAWCTDSVSTLTLEDNRVDNACFGLTPAQITRFGLTPIDNDVDNNLRLSDTPNQRALAILTHCITVRQQSALRSSHSNQKPDSHLDLDVGSSTRGGAFVEARPLRPPHPPRRAPLRPPRPPNGGTILTAGSTPRPSLSGPEYGGVAEWDAAKRQPAVAAAAGGAHCPRGRR